MGELELNPNPVNESVEQKGKSGGRKGNKKPKPFYHYSQLPEDLQKLVRDLLVEGAPFEDVVGTVADTGEATITQRAVEHYFRSKPDLQAERIRKQMHSADLLAKSLQYPESVEAELAKSVLILGLSGLHRRDQASGVKHAMQVIKEQKQERFKEADAQRKDAKFGIEEQESQIRFQSLQTKLQVATLQLGRLKQSIENQGKDKSLGPEILQQINEIYGLVSVENPGNATVEAHDE